MVRLKVKESSYVIREETSDKDYGEWYIENHHSIDGVVISETGEYELDVQIGDKVFVLYMLYTDGNSFGSESGLGEVLHVFKTYKEADEVLQYLYNLKDETKYRLPAKIEIPNTNIVIFNPATCYFTIIQSINIKETTVSRY